MLNEGLLQKRLRGGRRTSATGVVSFSASGERRRRDLLELLDRLTPTIAELTQAIEQEADKCTEAQRLHTPEVGSLTALAFVLIIGSTKRFQLWQADRELSGAGAVRGFRRARRRLGHITKQGNSLLRFLLVEAAQVTVRSDQEWRNRYFHVVLRRDQRLPKLPWCEDSQCVSTGFGARMHGSG